MKVQKTVFGFNVKDILKRIKETETIGGSVKEVVALPTYTGTVAYFDVTKSNEQLKLVSGNRTIILVRSN